MRSAAREDYVLPYTGWVSPMATLYEMESRLVSEGRAIGSEFDVWWTEEEFLSECDSEGIDREIGEKMLEWLFEKGRLVPSRPDEGSRLGFERFRTDTCELIRNSTFAYPRFFKENKAYSSTQAGVTWEVERKTAPRRDLDLGDSKGLLIQEVGDESEGFMDAVDAVFSGLEGAGFSSLSRFQVVAAADYLRHLLNEDGRHSIFTAGTGSGKSLAFQLAVIMKLAISKVTGTDTRQAYAFVFPRVALAIDQNNSLRSLCKEVNRALYDGGHVEGTGDGINVILDSGGKINEQAHRYYGQPKKEWRGEENYASVHDAQNYVFSLGDKAPHIVVTNPDTLRRRLWTRTASTFYRERARGVVLDEVHLYEGMTGANYSNVIRRFMAHSAPRKISVCGVSATVADPSGHMKNVVGVEAARVSVVSPSPDEMEEHGVVNHVLHSSIEGTSYVSNLTNMSSVQQHFRNRGRPNLRQSVLPDDEEDRAKEIRESRKAIGFADSLHLLGEWKYYLTDNEGLVYGTKQNYHWRFSRPLAHIEEVDRAEAERHCQSCCDNVESSLALPRPIEVDVLPHAHSGKAKKKLKIETINLRDGMGITDGCGFFNAGLCWRPESAFEEVDIVGKLMSSQSIIPSLVSSKTTSERKREGRDLENANELFQTNSRTVHRSRQAKSIEMVANMVLASPSMEVGVDLDNLTDAFLFKALRNVASYRQKVGRVGRERKVDAISQMLVSFRPLDYMYYQNPVTLLSDDHLDAIPIASENQIVKMNRGFEGVFDYLASHGCSFFRLQSNTVDLGRSLGMTGGYLMSNEGAIVRRLTDEFELTDREARRVFGRVKDYFEYLLSPLDEGGVSLLQSGSPKSLVQTQPASHKYVKRFQPTEKCHYLLELFGVLEDGLPVIFSELGASEGGPIDYEFIELLKDCERVVNPNQWIREGAEFIRLEEFSDILHNDEFYNGSLAHLFSKGCRGSANVLADLKDAFGKLRVFVGDIDHNTINGLLLIRDWNRYYRSKRENRGIFYFHDWVDKFHFSKSPDGRSIPTSLYSPPGTKSVELVLPDFGGGYRNEEVSIDEAMRHYLPGHVSYREMGIPMKTRLYRTPIPDMDRGYVEIDLSKLTAESLSSEGEKGGHRLTMTVKSGGSGLTADDLPWGVREIFGLGRDSEIKIREARKIVLSETSDRVRLDKEQMLMKDDDELGKGESEEDDEEESSSINLPQTYSNIWSRVLETEQGGNVRAFDDSGLWKDSDGDQVEFMLDSTVTSLFGRISYHESADIDEFAVGVVRKYQGMEDDVNFWYTNGGGDGSTRPEVIGHSHKAPALEFELGDENIADCSKKTVAGMVSGELWIEALGFLRATFSEKWGLGPFAADHLIRMLMGRVESGSGLHSYREAVCGLTDIDVDSYGSRWSVLVSTMGKAPSKMGSIKEALEENAELWADEGEVEALAKEWAVKCLVHSMGVSILQGSRAFTGCRDEDLGVAIEYKEGKAPLIWLYDRTNKGNGATKLVNRFFQIPMVLKHLRAHAVMSDTNKKLAALPSKDFMGVLLDFLRPCRNHEGGVVSMEIGRLGMIEPPVPGMPKLMEKARFLLGRYREDWDRMGFDMNEARRVSMMRHFECERDHVRNDELKKATGFCWTSCPICLEEMGASPLGPLTGPLYYNKRQLDRYVAGALTASNSMVERELSNDSIMDLSSLFGEMDTNVVPIDFRESGLGINPQVGSAEGSYVLRPLREVDLVQEFVDCSNPVTEEGSVNIRVRAIVTDSPWRKA